MNFNKIIIWGHKLHSHTHSYIHQAFNIAFTHLKYNVLWLDDNDDISNINFENVLFLTEHQVCKNIPIRYNCLFSSKATAPHRFKMRGALPVALVACEEGFEP